MGVYAMRATPYMMALNSFVLSKFYEWYAANDSLNKDKYTYEKVREGAHLEAWQTSSK